MFPREDLGAFLQALDDPSEGFVRSGVWRQKAAEGKAVDVELFSCPLPMDGTSSRLVVVNDLTERRWAEQMLLQVHAHTEQQLGARTMELDAAAQEAQAVAEFLRNLAARIPSSLLLDNDFSVSCALTEVSDNLLQLSRLSYVVLQPQDFDLAAMAREIAEGMQGADPGREIVFEIQPNMQVQADPAWMRQALQSLFRYLAGLSCKEGPTSLHLGTFLEGREVVYGLRHPGASFDAGLRDKLFQPLQDTAGPFKQPGGLVLARRIIAKHSGRIWTESVPGQGVALFFTLPMGREQDVAS